MKYIVFLIALLFSCTRIYNREEYMQWIAKPNNKLNKKVKTKSFNLQFMYEPAEFQIAKSSHNNIPSNISEVLKGYKENTMFSFRINHDEYGGNFILKQASDKYNYAKMKKYLEFDMKQNIFLVKEQDTFPCIIYHVERNYGLAPYTSSTLVFDTKQEAKDIQLIINDQEIGFGKIKTLFSKNDISNLPQLRP